MVTLCSKITASRRLSDEVSSITASLMVFSGVARPSFSSHIILGGDSAQQFLCGPQSCGEHYTEGWRECGLSHRLEAMLQYY